MHRVHQQKEFCGMLRLALLCTVALGGCVDCGTPRGCRMDPDLITAMGVSYPYHAAYPMYPVQPVTPLQGYGGSTNIFIGR